MARKKDLQESLNDLQSMNSMLEISLEGKSKELNRISAENSVLNEKIEENAQVIAEREEEIRRFRDLLDQKEFAVIGLERELAELRANGPAADSSKFEDMISELKNELAEKTGIIEAQCARISELEKLRTEGGEEGGAALEYINARNECERLKAELKRSDEDKDDLREQVKQLTADNLQYKEQAESFWEENRKLKGGDNRDKDIIDTALLSELQRLREENQSLKEKAGGVSLETGKEAGDLELQIDRYAGENIELRAECERLRAELERLREDNELLSREAQRDRSELSRLKSELSKADSTRSEQIGFADYKKLSRLQELEKNSLKEQLEKLAGELAQANLLCRRLEREKVQLKSEAEICTVTAQAPDAADIGSIFIEAHSAAKNILDSAKLKADEMLAEAESKADRLVNSAEKKSDYYKKELSRLFSEFKQNFDDGQEIR